MNSDISISGKEIRYITNIISNIIEYFILFPTNFC